jgi:hypothetical protein
VLTLVVDEGQAGLGSGGRDSAISLGLAAALIVTLRFFWRRSKPQRQEP